MQCHTCRASRKEEDDGSQADCPNQTAILCSIQKTDAVIHCSYRLCINDGNNQFQPFGGVGSALVLGGKVGGSSRRGVPSCLDTSMLLPTFSLSSCLQPRNAEQSCPSAPSFTRLLIGLPTFGCTQCFPKVKGERLETGAMLGQGGVRAGGLPSSPSPGSYSGHQRAERHNPSLSSLEKLPLAFGGKNGPQPCCLPGPAAL